MPSILTVLFSVIGVAAWVTTAVVRGKVVRSSGRELGALAESPEHVALLAGGAGQVVLVTIVGLVERKLLTAATGKVRACGLLPVDATAVEIAVHRATGTPVTRSALRAVQGVRDAIAPIEATLEELGLLAAPREASRLRAIDRVMTAVAACGVVGVVWGFAFRAPDWQWLVMTVVFGVVAIRRLRSAPDVSAAACKEIDRLAEHHAELRPALKPDWDLYGPQRAALGVALFGEDAIWASRPSLASALNLLRGAQPAARRPRVGRRTATAGYSGGTAWWGAGFDGRGFDGGGIEAGGGHGHHSGGGHGHHGGCGGGHHGGCGGGHSGCGGGGCGGGGSS